VMWQTAQPDYCPPIDETSGIDNCWTHYFQAGVADSALPARRLVRSEPKISVRTGFCQHADVGFAVHDWHPANIAKSSKLRSATEGVFERYLQLEPHLAAKVEHFREQHFLSQPVVGVHVRMGDGAREYGQAPIDMDFYLNASAQLAEELGSAHGGEGKVRFYVASNSDKAVDAFRARFGAERVLSNLNAPHLANASNSTPDTLDNSGVLCDDTRDPDCWRKNAHGVIMDIWLLSICDRFVYWRTSMAWAVLLKRQSLRSIRVGPPPEQYDPELLDSFARKDLNNTLASWRMTVGQSEEEFANQLSTPIASCKACRAILTERGMTPDVHLHEREDNESLSNE